MESLIICKSEHHENTQKIAESMADILNAEAVEPKNVDMEDVQKYDLIGFGSGIYFGKHHKRLLKLVDELPEINDKKAFVFATSGMGRFPIFHEFNKALKEKLVDKGFDVVDTFSCRGWDTNGIVGIFGGLNKGRPNQNDIENAKEFIKNLIESLGQE